MSPKQLRTVISENVQRLRKHAHMTQLALATACECKQANISRIEKGLVGCSDEMLAKLSEALDCHPATFMMEATASHRSAKLKIGA